MWTLLGGTDYLRVPALGWVIFVSVVCWVLTVCLLLLYLTSAHTKISCVSWSTLVSVAKGQQKGYQCSDLVSDHFPSFKSYYFSQGVCFNSSATILYLTAAVINATSVPQAIRGRYYYISWVASTVRGREVSFPFKSLISLE